MRELNVAARSQGILSRRTLQELSMLQARLRRVSGLRRTALRILLASRRVTTAVAQREFWLEFFRLDQEYRAAVRRLAQFCTAHTQCLDDLPVKRVVERGADRRAVAARDPSVASHRFDLAHEAPPAGHTTAGRRSLDRAAASGRKFTDRD